MICQFCSYEFPDKCGKYGCPNCEGTGGTMSPRGEQLIGSSANRATLCELIAQREAENDKLKRGMNFILAMDWRTHLVSDAIKAAKDTMAALKIHE